MALVASLAMTLVWLTDSSASPSTDRSSAPTGSSALTTPSIEPAPVSSVRDDLNRDDLNRDDLNRDYIDIAYAAQSPSQRLNLHLPRRGQGPFPVVVWIHGGGWEGGGRGISVGDPQHAVVESGYAVASVDYRLSQEAVFPAQLLDVKAAVRYLRANARELGVDADRIGVWGDSAGGHLAALLGTSGDVPGFDDPALGNEGVSSRVQAVVDWYGPSSFTTIDGHLAEGGCTRRIDGRDSTVSRLIGEAVPTRLDLARAASPVTYATADDPPFLIQHGRDDCVVPWQQGAELAQVLNVQRVDATLVLFDHARHGGADFVEAANLARVVAFLDTNLR